MKCNILNVEGKIEYSTGLMLQKSALYNIKNNEAYDTLILLRHTPTITLGYFAKNRNVLAPNNFLLKRGIQVHRTDRGGDVTYHGPGQLICYPDNRCPQKTITRIQIQTMPEPHRPFTKI